MPTVRDLVPTMVPILESEGYTVDLDAQVLAVCPNLNTDSLHLTIDSRNERLWLHYGEWDIHTLQRALALGIEVSAYAAP